MDPQTNHFVIDTESLLLQSSNILHEAVQTHFSLVWFIYCCQFNNTVSIHSKQCLMLELENSQLHIMQKEVLVA